jgi:hypothetical protein
MSQIEKRKLHSNAVHIAIRKYRTWRTPRLPLLMHTLASYGSPEGKNIWPGVGHLADDENCSTRQIQRLLHELERDGFIVTLNKKGGRGHRTEYGIVLKKLGICIEDSVTPEVTAPPPIETSSNVTPNLPEWGKTTVTDNLTKWREMERQQLLALENARLRKDSLYIEHAQERLRKAQEKIAELEHA